MATMSDEKRRLYGRICLWAGIIGGLQAVILVAVPAQVDDDRFSYPFDVTGHAVAQTSFFVQHLGLVVGLLALCSLAASRDRRSTRLALHAGTLGMALLALMELIAIAPAADLATSDLAELVSGLYSVPVLLLGVGLLVGGVGVARRTERTDPAWVRWVPASLGAWVFVPLTPALMGSFEAGRAAIGSWMLLFAALGWAFSRRTLGSAGEIDELVALRRADDDRSAGLVSAPGEAGRAAVGDGTLP